MMIEQKLGRLVSPECRKHLVDLRHDLHRHPELSGKEEHTTARLERELTAICPDSVSRITGTGVMARIAGEHRNAPTVAIRGDIDALPIQEESGAEFASAHDGVMHACGHDVHAAWTIGAAHLLVETPAQGDVLVLLQPAEETAHGAVSFIEAGVLNGVAAIIGAHVDMHYALGEVVAEAGSMAASADEFDIVLTGAGCHAARPHEGVNPILGAAALVQALQTIVQRQVEPNIPAVLSVATISAGTASNIIPATARLSGTVRATDPETRSVLLQAIQAESNAVAASHGIDVSVTITQGTPPLVNEHAPIRWVREAVQKILGDDALVPLSEPNLGGEDFASYMEQVAGCFFRIGGRGPGQSAIPAHTSLYVPDDDAVLVGSIILAEAARIASLSLSNRDG